MAISRESLEKFRKVLLEEKERLEGNTKALKNMDFGSSPGMDNEEADESEEAANNLGTIEALGERVAHIDGALLRMDKGTYGICENCRKEISEELLEANPESATCRECKS